VQLRTNSRGETSGALLDCLAYGVPTIINSNGSLAETREGAVVRLQEEFEEADLIRALEQVHDDREYRSLLSQAGRELIASDHHPCRIGEMYRDAIESFMVTEPMANEQRLLRNIAALSIDDPPTSSDLETVARAIATQRPGGMKQLFLDVSATATQDLKTGIERVARGVTLELIRNPEGLRIEPICRRDDQWRYARRFALETINAPLLMEETPLDFHPGDLYLALDWSPETVCASRDFFVKLRANNIQVHFVIYDLLPILRPEMFPSWASEEFRRWLDAVCEFSDGVACISRSVADELIKWLDDAQPPRLRPLRIGYFHLGADIEPGLLPAPGEDDTRRVDALRKRPTVLMVGTVEPRKGHALVLDAFEQLWREGVEVNLAIVGKEGWEVQSLAGRLHNHKRNGTHLFWFAGISDATLAMLYRASSGLLAASVGEGFGLPLVEAARHHLPVIARDIPVFREVAGEHAFYFDGDTPQEVASSIKSWLELLNQGGAPSSEGIECLTWKESAGQLRDVIFHGKTYRSWMPENVVEHL
jgi:glycosyltransferase involved in cell wall biosynthesis